MEYLNQEFDGLLKSLRDDDRLEFDHEEEIESFLKEKKASVDCKKTVKLFFELLDNLDLIDEDNGEFFSNKKKEILSNLKNDEKSETKKQNAEKKSTKKVAEEQVKESKKTEKVEEPVKESKKTEKVAEQVKETKKLSNYLMFCNENRKDLKDKHPDATFTEMSKILSQAWKEYKGALPENQNIKKLDYDTILHMKFKDLRKYASQMKFTGDPEEYGDKADLVDDLWDHLKNTDKEI